MEKENTKKRDIKKRERYKIYKEGTNIKKI